LKEVPYIRVSLWVLLEYRVVHIPGFLPPWIEHNFFIGMVARLYPKVVLIKA